MPVNKKAKTAARKPARAPTARRRPVQSRHTKPAAVVNKAGASPASAGRATDPLTREVAQLRETLNRLVVTPAISGTTDEVNAIRRIVADIMESRMTVFLQKLASIRHSVPLESVDLVSRIDSLLEDMGGLTYTAERLEHLDPVIHEVGRETQDGALPDSVIVETIRPGWRTVRGQVLSRALVCLNRRP